MSDSWNPICFASLVEGHGEVKAVEILIRKIAAAEGCTRPLQCFPPLRVKRDRFLKREAEGEFGRSLQLAAKNIRGKPGVLLVLLDAEGDCPVTLAQRIRNDANPLVGDVRLSVVIAKRMFENWLAASAPSLSSDARFRKGLIAPDHPEELSGKNWIKQNLLPLSTYSEPVDQPELTRLLDLESSGICRSFRKFRKEIQTALSHTS